MHLLVSQNCGKKQVQLLQQVQFILWQDCKLVRIIRLGWQQPILEEKDKFQIQLPNMQLHLQAPYLL